MLSQREETLVKIHQICLDVQIVYFLLALISFWTSALNFTVGNISLAKITLLMLF